MTVGALTETVQVAGTTGIDVTTPDVAHTVDQKYYEDLPFITGSDVRLAESVLLMQPGYLPMRPNGDPMFRGSQFNSRINGGQAMATENFFDGAAFGYASGHQQSHESTPPVEAIQEVKVISTTYSAQYGHTSGGFIEYTSKSGTNDFHGSVYHYFADDSLNKNSIFAERTGRPKTPLTNNNPGFTLGGPVRAPGLQRPEQHVLLHEPRLHADSVGHGGRLRQHDADRRVQERRLQRPADRDRRLARTRSAGRSSRADLRSRDSTRLVNGVAGPRSVPEQRQIPANHPLRSHVASRVVPLMVRPDREGLSNNVAGVGTGDQTWELDARNIMFRIDHNFTPELPREPQLLLEPPSVGQELRRPGRLQLRRQSGERSRPRIPTTTAAGSFSASRPTTPTSSSTGSSSNNLLNHSTIAWDRWFMGGNHLSAGANWPQRLWEGTRAPVGGIVAHGRGAADHEVQRRERAVFAHRTGRVAASSASRRTTAGSSRTTSPGSRGATR